MTISFRSTEFLDDSARDNQATNAFEVKDFGWGFGQIDDMEQWYADLIRNRNITANDKYNVTGYSLGGHLATAFNLLRLYESNGSNFPIAGTYTFNGAGVGTVKAGQLLNGVMAEFRNNRANPGSIHLSQTALDDLYHQMLGRFTGTVAPTQLDIVSVGVLRLNYSLLIDATDFVDLQIALRRVTDILDERDRVAGLRNSIGERPVVEGAIDQASLGYQMAVLRAARSTEAISVTAGVFNTLSGRRPSASFTITNFNDIYSTGIQAVANSQLHYGAGRDVFIEDQPLARGNIGTTALTETLKAQDIRLLGPNYDLNDFGDTHSLVLMIDSLSTMDAISKIDSSLTQDQIQSIFKSVTNGKGVFMPGGQGKADGAMLETVLNALRNVLLGDDAPEIKSTNVNGVSNLEGNTWYDAGMRNDFHTKLAELNSKVLQLKAGDADAGISLIRLVSLAQAASGGLAASAKGDDSAGIAYRYALANLNPFAVLGVDYEGLHNLTGELDLYDPEFDDGLTDKWIEDRAAYLAALNKYNTDNRSDRIITGDTSIIDNNVQEQGRARFLAPSSNILKGVAFANDAGGELKAYSLRTNDADIFGSDANDTIFGVSGNNYIEGGFGADTITTAGGNDEIWGGAGDDTVDAGSGNNTVYGGDNNDTITVSGSGTNTIYGDAKAPEGEDPTTWESDILVGDDTITTSGGTNTIYGGGGDDTITTGSGVDTIYGGTGADKIDAGGAADTVYGGDGDDTIKGGDGADTLFGDVADADSTEVTGEDTLYGGGGKDTIHGGAGDDTIYGGDSASDNSGPGNTLFGDAGDDTIYGDGQQDIISGGENEDTLIGNFGSDYLIGNEGDDILWGDTEDEADTSNGADFLFGNEGDDELFGGGGKDVLDGGTDDDLLAGGYGVGDFLKGGTGVDEYRIKSKHGDDIIYDADGQGKVNFTGATLSGGTNKSKGQTTWYDNPDNPVYQFTTKSGAKPEDRPGGLIGSDTGAGDGGEELIVKNLKTGDLVRIEHFYNGDLDIRLDDGKNKGKIPPPGQGTPAGPDKPPGNPGGQNRGDPLVIDLAGLGFSTASSSSTNPADTAKAGTVGFSQNLHFDLDGDGFAEKTGWVNANAGVLMIDRDASGDLTDGQEVFGDLTKLNGGQLAANGFQALSQYDRNHDGIIDANDPVWASLKIARFETNPATGEVLYGDPGNAMELISLTDLGIKAIHLGSTLNANPLMDGNGNTQTRISSIEMVDGSTRAIAEYRFARDEGDTRFTQWQTETPEITALPELKLGGRVMDLHQALIRDAEATGYNGHTQGALRAALDAYLGAVASATGSGSGSQGAYPSNLNPGYPASNPYAAREAAFNTLFSVWTGTDSIEATATTGAANARHMAVLEKVYGGRYQNANADQASVWETTYRRLAETYYGSLAAQTHFKSNYDAIDWQPNLSVDQTIGQLGAVQGAFDARLAVALVDDVAASAVSVAAGGSTVTIAQDGVNAEINEFGRVLRGLGLQRETSYFAFREHFITYPDGSLNELRAFAFDAAGVPLSPIEDGSFDRQNPFTQATLDTLGNNALQGHYALYGNGGDDVLYDLTGRSRQVVGDVMGDGGRSVQAASTTCSCGGAAKSLRSGCGMRGGRLRWAAKGENRTCWRLETGMESHSMKCDDAKPLVEADIRIVV